MKSKRFINFMSLLLVFAAVAFSVPGPDRSTSPAAIMFACQTAPEVFLVTDADGKFYIEWQHTGYGGTTDIGSPIAMAYFEIFIKHVATDSIISENIYLTWNTDSPNNEGRYWFEKEIQIPVDPDIYTFGAQAVNANDDRSSITWASQQCITQSRKTPPENVYIGFKCRNL
jgi:hypothetical protein